MQALFIEGREITMATTLNELTPRQLRQFVVWQDNAHRPDNLWQLLFILMGKHAIWFRWWLFVQHRLKPFIAGFGFNLNARQLDEEQINDLLEIPLRILESKVKLARQKQPVIWVRLWYIIPFPLYGPSELLTTSSYRQYRQAESALAQSNQNPYHTLYLARFVASLYRPPRWAFFLSNDTITTALFHVDHTRLESVKWFFVGCRHYLRLQHKELFPNRGVPKTQKIPTPSEITDDFNSIRRSLAQHIVHEEKVDNMPLWDVFGWADYQARKHREEKEFWEQQKAKK